MTFNQVIWDALLFAEAASQKPAKAESTGSAAYRRGQVLLAIELYAMACDGKAQMQQCGDIVVFAFIPNPIPRY